MESNEKTFRYSQIKCLGVFYLMFLVLCVVAGLFVGIREFMFFAILIGIGVILLLLFLTTSVTISDSNITTRYLFGKNHSSGLKSVMYRQKVHPLSYTTRTAATLYPFLPVWISLSRYLT